MRRNTSMSSIVPVPVPVVSVPMVSSEVEPTDDSAMNPVLDFERDVVGHGSEFANLGMVVTTDLYGGGGGASSGGGFGAGCKRDAAAAHFLEACGLCKRRLFPGRDIYMLRGDTAFCSLECREQMMKQEKRKSRRNPNNPCSPKPDGFGIDWMD
ncbi:hypothetical protein MLD38_009325 [Melastoma candidum]|uniref:Uncharacterized protein n=1 Tax=Melastoma candidum TaxID=119954 RepID=A0ACB9RYH2_9MYRT|nr:hypothetical protein MLD38_009325 [Melastoma candidum]